MVELFKWCDVRACDRHVDLVIQTCRGTERELILMILMINDQDELKLVDRFSRSFKDMFEKRLICSDAKNLSCIRFERLKFYLPNLLAVVCFTKSPG